MTPAWKAMASERLLALGWTRKDLADKIGVTKSAISQMLGDAQGASAHVPLVCDVLGLPMPVFSESDELRALIEQLSDEDRRAITQMARALLRRSPR